MKNTFTRSIFFTLFIIFTNSLFSQTANVTTLDQLVCPNTSVDLVITFTGAPPYTFDYTYNAGVTPVVTSDNPVSIPISAIADGNVVISNFTYNGGTLGGLIDDQFVITLHPAISISIPLVDPSYVEMGQNLNITTNLAGGGGGESYVWTGHASVTGSIVSSATFNSGVATGSFVIASTVTDANLCEATDNLNVNAVNLVVSTSSTPVSASICEGSTITMDGIAASGSGFYTHSWTWASAGGATGSFDFPTNEDPIFTPDGPDVFTLTYTVTDTKTGQVEFDDIVVTVNPSPAAKTVVPTDYCFGAAGAGTIVLQSSGAATVSYQLYTSGGATVQAAKPGTAGGDLTWTNITGTALGSDYYVRATEATCYTNMPNVTVVSNALPTTAPTATPAVICAGSSSTLDPDALTAVSYSWRLDTTDVEFSTDENPVVSPTSFTEYYVIVTDANGCQNIKTPSIPSTFASVTVNAAPTININDDQSNTFEICEGEDIILTGTSTNTIVDWDWTTGDATPSATVDPTTTTSYKLTIEDDNGCKNSKTQIVTVYDRPTANAGSDEIMCFGVSVNLTASATDGDGSYVYTWNTGDIGATVNVNPLNTTTYTVTVEDGNNCIHTDEVQVVVVSNPTVSVGAAPTFSTSICTGETTDLLATPAGGTGAGTYTYNWIPGGQTSQTISVAPTNPALTNPTAASIPVNYEVTVTDGNGCKAFDDVDVTVFALTLLSIDNDGNSYCHEGMLPLTANPQNASSVWGSPSGGFVVGSTFDSDVSAGTYTIEYEYTNSNGCTNDITGSVDILDYAPPIPTDIIIDGESDFCDDDATLHAVAGELIPDISGLPGVVEVISGPGIVDDGSGNGTGTFQASVAGPGTHTITYTITTPGCSETWTEDVNVGLPVVVVPLVDMCVGDGNQVLDADNITGEWRIEFTDDATSTMTPYGPYPYGDAQATLQAIEPGVYEVFYDVVDAGISCNSTTNATVIVHALPVLSFNIGSFLFSDGGINFCDNGPQQTLIGNQPGGIFSGAGVTTNLFDPAVGSGGNPYTIDYDYTDGFGCSSTITSQNITINEEPVVDITGLNLVYCGDALDFTITGSATPAASASGVFTFPLAWADGTEYTLPGIADGTALISPSNVDPTGTFTIQYEVDSDEGCTSSKSKSFTINQVPTVDFSGLPATICKNAAAITITGSPAGATGVFTGDGITDNGDGTAIFDPALLSTGDHSITYTYTDPVTLCDNSSLPKVVKVLALPTKFSVTSPGPDGLDYCSLDDGILIGISGSQAAHTYYLMQNGLTQMATVPGTGLAVTTFGDLYPVANYTVIAENDATLCRSTFNNTITPAEIPAIDDAGSIVGPANICADGTTVYTYSVPTIANATNHVWTLPVGVTIDTDNDDEIKVIFDATFVGGAGNEFEVYGEDPSTICPVGNPSTKVVNKNVSPIDLGATIVSSLGAAPFLVCEGETGVTFSVNPSDFSNETSFEWTITGGATITSVTTSNSITVDFDAISVSGIVSVRAVSACGNTVWRSQPVTVDPIPNVSINAVADDITCDPASTVQLVAASTEAPANITGWLWTASNGGVIVPGDETLSNPFVSHEGDFEVEITVFKNLSCTNVFSTSVGADKAAPTASIDAHGVLDCNNTTLALKGNSTTPSTFAWTYTPPANITVGANTDNPTVDAPGVYTLTVTDLNNSCTVTETTTVTKNVTKPNISVISPVADTLKCTNTVVQVEGLVSTTPNVSYSWTGPGGAAISSPNNRFTNVNLAGDYTFRVTDDGVGGNGCYDELTVTVIENRIDPDIPVIVNNDAVQELTCLNTAVELEASTNVANATFVWSRASGAVGAATGTYDQLLEATTPDDYSVVATDPANGCTATSNLFTVAPDTRKGTVSIINGATDVITCDNGEQLTLTGSVSGDAFVGTYEWTYTVGGNIVGATNGISCVIDEPATYTFTYYHSETGCSNSVDIIVTENTTDPIISIAGAYELTCTDDELILTGVDGSATPADNDYSWAGPAGGINSGALTLTPTVDVTGTYTITATNTTNNCTATASVFVDQDISTPNISVNPSNAYTCDNPNPTISGDSPDGVSFLWSRDSGTGTIAVPTQKTTTVNGDGVFRLTVTAANGCTSSATTEVALDRTPPNITNLINNDAVQEITCSNTEVELEATSNIADATFIWTAGAGGAIVGTSGTYDEVLTVSAAADYSVVAEDPSNGCISATSSITVDPDNRTGTVSITNGATDIITCDNSEQLTLTGSVAGDAGVGTYKWTYSAGGNIIGADDAISCVIDEPATYTFTYYHSETGCSNSVDIIVTENTTDPIISIAGAYELTCTDDELILTGVDGSATPADNDYSWAGPAGGINSGALTLTPTVDVTGTYTITATNTTNNCTATASVFVDQDISTPNISVNPSNAYTCDNPNPTISGDSPDGVSFLWSRDSGTGTIAVPTQKTTTVNGDGVFRLTVTAANGCTSSATTEVALDRTPPNITNLINNDAVQEITCSNTEVELEATSNIVDATFIWTAGAGGAIVGTSGTYDEVLTVSAAADYSVVAEDPSNGCISATSSITVDPDNRTGTVSITNGATDIITCDNSEQLTLTGSVAGDAGVGTYKWTYSAGGNIIGADDAISCVIDEPATYTFTYYHSETGCSNSVDIIVTENTTDPIISIAGAYELTCTDDELILTGVDGSATPADNDYSWAGPAGGINSGALTLTPTVDVAGTYTITATNTTNNCTATASVFVDEDKDIPSLGVNNPADITCANLTSTISGTSPDNVTYLWTRDSGAGNIDNINSQNTFVDDEGVFRLRATSNDNGCYIEKTVTVGTNYDAPTITFTSDPVSGLTCSTTQVQLEAFVAPAGSGLSWSTTSGGTISNTGVSDPFVNAAGDYTLVATHPLSGCPTTDVVEVTEDKTAPVIDITSLVTEIDCNNTTIELDASGTTDISGTDTWNWVASTGGSIVSGQGTNKLIIDDSGNFTLTATNAATGCTTTSAPYIITKDFSSPNIAMNAGTYEITCTDATEQLSANDAPGNPVGTVYSWDGPVGAIITNSGDLDPIVNMAGNYVLTATSPNGCESQVSVDVDDNTDAPHLSVHAPNPLEITCAEGSSTLSASSNTAGVAYLWTRTSGAAVITNANNQIATVNAEGDFMVTVTAQNGCTTTGTTSVGSDFTPPSVNVLAVPDLTCTNPSVEIGVEPTGAGTDYSYSWATTITGATINQGNTSTPIVDKTGVYTATITDNVNGCSTTQDVTVDENDAQPTITMGGPFAQITCTNTSVDLNATVNNGTNYEWYSNNGGTILANPTTLNPTVGSEGRFYIRAEHTVSGCKDSAYVDITADSSVPEINNFDASPGTLTCTATTLTLTGDATDVANKIWLWETSDGTIDAGGATANPTISEAGTYTLTLTDDDNGCFARSSVTVLDDIEEPVINITESNILTCDDVEVNLNSGINPASGNYDFTWTTAGAGAIKAGTENSPVATVSTVATYTLVVEDLDNGCSSSDNFTTSKDFTKPIFTISTPNDLTCDSLTVKLKATVTNLSDVSYNWSNNGTAVIINASGNNPTVNELGWYYLVVENNETGCTTMDSIYVDENKVSPSISQPVVSNDITCSLTTSTLTAQSNPNYNYTWSGTPNPLTPNSTSTAVTAVGNYNLVVEDKVNGCKSYYSVTVNPDIDPVNSPIISDESTCFGVVPNPTFVKTSGTNIKWYNDITHSALLGTGDTYTPTETASGLHKYYATATGSNGCESNNTEIVLTINELPDAPSTNDNSICEGEANSQLTAVGSDINWYDTGNINVGSGNSFSIPLAISAVGSYSYYATETDINGCESEQSEAVYTIVQVPAAPSFVSPAIEGCETETNPSFTIIGTNVKWYENLGGSIISTDNTYQPNKVIPGVYTYYATQTVNGCQSPTQSGTLTINAMPLKYNVTGGGSYCADLAGVPVGLSNSQIGVTYELWLDDSELVTDMPGTGAAISFGNQTEGGNYTIKAYNATSLCERTMLGGVTVTVKPLPGDAGIITGNSSVCQNEEGIDYTIDPVSNATNYVWTVPAGFSIVSGDGSNSITVDLDNTAADGDITVYAENACNVGETSPIFAVVVNPIPGDAINLTGPNVICNDEDGVVYKIDAIPGATSYVWSVPVGGTIVSGDGSRQITVDFNESAVSDDISVYGKNSCGNGVATSMLVTVNNLPAVSAGNEQNLCTNATVLAGSVIAGGSGLWTTYNGAVTYTAATTENSGITNIGRGKNTLIWTVTDANGCVNADTVDIYNNTVYVNAGGDADLCVDYYTLNGNTPSVGTSSWGIVQGSASIYQPTLPNAVLSEIKRGENIFVWQVTNNGCLSSDTVIINNNLPSAPVAGSSSDICTDNYSLMADIPTIGTGAWSVVGGAGTFDNPLLYNAHVSNLQSGENTLRWTVSNENCSLYDQIVLVNNQIEVDAGPSQVVCDRIVDLEAEYIAGSTGNWSVISGSASFDDIASPVSRVTSLVPDTNIFRWSVNVNNCFSSDSVIIINNRPTTANAGSDKNVFELGDLEGNTPVEGTGLWSVIDGYALFDDLTSPTAHISELNPGRNTFRWTITKENCISFDDVSIINESSDAPYAGPDQTLCNTNTTQLNATAPEYGFGTWSVISGTIRFVDPEVHNTTAYDIAHGTNELLWTVNVGGLEFYDTLVVVNNSPTTANAGIDQRLCGDSTQLEGNASAFGVGKWVLLSGSATIADSSKFNTSVTNLGKGQSTFKWVINNNNCLTTDEVNIYNDLPTVADAGFDKTTCQDSIVLNPNTPTFGTGSWSVYSGAAVFEDNYAYNLSVGANKLKWTIVNNQCESFDTVTITSYKPTTANSGSDASICDPFYQLNGNPQNLAIGEIGTWSLISGSGLIADDALHNSDVVNLSLGKNVFRWEIENNGCISYDEVILSYDFIQATAGVDQLLCADETILNANNPSSGIGEWSIVGGSGTALFENSNSPNTKVSDLDRGSNYFQWTITNYSCVSVDTVVIDNSNPSTAFAGINRSVCTNEAILAATPADPDSEGTWTILSGSALFDDPVKYDAHVTNLGYGSNTFRWTTKKGNCTSMDEVVISNNLPINTIAGQDQVLCDNKTFLGANEPTNGKGIWSVVQGAAIFADATSNNTEVSSLSPDEVILRWTVQNEQCSDHDEVSIYNNKPSVARAGADKVICDSTIILDANIPQQGDGTWTVISGAGEFDNAIQNNTSVSELSNGDNVLRWTILKVYTDENGNEQGCKSEDDVVITNNRPTMPIAGTNASICDDNFNLNANYPTHGSGYWSVISGKGVFDNFENYNTAVRDLGQGTNKLRWTITHNGCSEYDDVTIKNNIRDVNAGEDQSVYDNFSTLIGNIPSDLDAIGTWNLIAGSGTLESSNNYRTNVTELDEGANTFSWNIDIEMEGGDHCISTDVVLVTYYKMPKASYSLNENHGCPPFEARFTKTEVDEYNYYWDFGDGTQSTIENPSHIYDQPGRYPAKLIVTGPDGSDVVTQTIITIHEMPVADFSYAPDSVFIANPNHGTDDSNIPLQLYNLSIDGYRYLWDFGDQTTSDEPNPSHYYTEPGLYSIQLNAYTEFECKDSILKKDIVKAVESGYIVAPTAFTPDLSGPSDGRFDIDDFTNNVFFLIFDGVEEYHMEIFNRWGVRVFESTDVNIGWDGWIKNRIAPEGVYVYRVKVIFNNGRPKVQAGDFLLIHKGF